jgi:hypothetical protein
MIVAGLDIATHTGACLGEPGQTPEFFTRDLGQGRSHDLRFSNAMRLAHELISERGVTFIGIEAPVQAKHHKRSQNELLMGLIANVRGWAALKGIECQVFEIGAIDKSFLNQGGFKRADRKRAILTRCKSLGWTPETQDEADAGSVFFHACATKSRSFAIHNTPLFQGRGAA